MVRKVAGIVLLVLAVGSGIGYVILGGLKQPIIAKKTVSGYNIAGIPYKGNASDEKLAEIFNQVRQYNQNGTLAGTLAAVYYDTLGVNKGNVDCFIGVMVADTSTVLPVNFSIKNIRAKEVVQAHVQAHFLVAPSPEKVQAQLKDYANNRGLQLENFLIEKYLDESNFMLEVPITTN